MSKVGQPVFALERAGRRFGDVVALHDVSFTVWPGERVALVGPSGAGKSTLLALLNGSLSPTEGEVRVLGQPIARLDPDARRALQRQIGTMYQQFHLVDNLRVIHNVNAGHLARWSWGKSLLSLVWPLDRATAVRALAQVGIPEKLYARTGHLSGGQQQRVALARVLVQDPRVILADEPVSSLDPERGREMMRLLSELGAAAGRTLVVSLHLMELARTYCQRLIGLRAGEVVFDLPPEQVTAERITSLYQIESEASDRGGHRPATGAGVAGV